MPALRAAAGGRQALFIRSNADIRALSMSIFERTFIITRVLYWLAAGLPPRTGQRAARLGAGAGAAACAAAHARVTPRGTALLVIARPLFMGLAALLAAIPAGLLTALVLTQVINRRAFGWQIDLHLSVAAVLQRAAACACGSPRRGPYPAWRSARAPLARGLREE